MTLCRNCGCEFTYLLSYPRVGPVCPVCQVPLGSKRRRKSRYSGGGAKKLRAVAVRDGWQCHLCKGPVEPRGEGGSAPSLDHVIPYSKGGSNANENLRLAHAGCNNKRGDSALDMTSGAS